MGATDRAGRNRRSMTVPDAPSGLTPFQVTVATVFFSLPESDGFLLAGGAALVAQNLTSRPTQDLDLFTRAGRGRVPAARDAFEAAAHNRGWSVRRIRDTETFCRLVVSGDDELLVDLALDSPPSLPPSTSIAGPTFGLEELAGRKVIALFDRAEARDFADVFALSQQYDNELLLRRAAEIDAGFEPAVFADMLRTLGRFTDDEIPVDPGKVAGLRDFFHRWLLELQSSR
jgi:hypothetical protein